MKKQLTVVVAMAAFVGFVGAGCSNHNIDTAKVRAAFPSIDGDAKVQLETGLTAIDAGNFAAAIKPLEKASFEMKMDKDQRKILVDTLKKARAKAKSQK